jgi:hypothetical protein
LNRTSWRSVGQALVEWFLRREALARAGNDQPAVEALRFQRTYRLVITALTTALVTIAMAAGVSELTKGPDLAEGRPWRASSTYPTGDVGRAFFFHTKNESNPWVEIDLGDSVEFDRVDVVNRLALPGRAVPLIVEASDSQSDWRPLARHNIPFTRATLEFPLTRARYVRLRVPRRVYFHLRKVAVYRSAL